MIHIDIKGLKEVQQMLDAIPKQASRAAEIALDKTAKVIRDDIKAEMKSVFDRPVPYTINSLQVTPTHNHNMQASVWFKDPPRMGQHYLVPQVEGGKRKLKGFERGVDLGKMVPGKGAKMDRYGNVSTGQIKQIMSVLSKAETSAGYSANITDRSRKRNTKERDYVVIHRRNGRLLPGVYQRYQTGAGFGHKTKKTFTDRSRSYQKGNRKQAVRDPRTGRIVKWFGQDSVFWEGSRIQSVIRARGLKPILIQGRQGDAVKPLLDFYGVAHATFNRAFMPLFWANLESQLRR